MSKQTNHTADWLREPAAKALSLRIARYWENKGYDIAVWLEPITGDGHKERRYGIRSSLLNGLPRGQRVG